MKIVECCCLFYRLFQVEIGELRKELQEKQDLLCQAAEAMELMEESQRKAHDKSSMTITDLSQKIKYLEVNSIDIALLL